MLIKGEILYKISLGFNMRKIISFLVFVNIAVFAYSQPNYANGNGTIIKVENAGNTTKTFRKHIQRIQIKEIFGIDGYFIENDLNLYKNPEINGDEIVGKLNYGDFINIEQILEMNTGKKYLVWLNIRKDDGIKGWLFWGECETRLARSYAPYFNNKWEIIERINVGNKIWTVRKLETSFLISNCSIYDKPGLENKNKISEISESNSAYDNMSWVGVIAVTEEEETIEGSADRWLKIKYEGIEGWIGGWGASAERGGLKYNIPEDYIELMLTWSY